MRPRVGRVQRAVRRALIAAGGQPVPTRELMRWCWPRASRYRNWDYCTVRRAAERWCVRVGNVGRAVLWAPNEGLARLLSVGRSVGTDGESENS
jgi:hypothetical protein